MLVEISNPSIRQGQITAKLTAALVENKPYGAVLSGTAFVLDSENTLIPDVAFVSLDRLRDSEYDMLFQGAPDLAVEVVSSTDLLFDVEDKIDQYLAAGVKIIWLLNPRRKTVSVYRQGAKYVQLLNHDDALSGEDLLPNFSFPLRLLFG